MSIGTKALVGLAAGLAAGAAIASAAHRPPDGSRLCAWRSQGRSGSTRS